MTSPVQATGTPTPAPAFDRSKGPPDTIIWRFNDDPIPSNTVFTGGCHCGAVRFSFTGPPLTRQPGFHIPVKHCNCGICGNNAYLMVYTDRKEIEWTDGSEAALVEYKFSTGKKAHRFCGRCGSSICMDMTGSWKEWAGDVVGINLRMLDDFDANNFDYMNLQKKDGKSFVPKTT